VAPLLEVVDVTRKFGSLTVIDGISLSLNEGEALGVVGPNGAGKTTLLNLIAGDLLPGSGRVMFDGADVTRLPTHTRCRLGIGRTSQIPRPFERLTVFENVMVGSTFGTGSRFGGRAEEAAADALNRTGLRAKANALAGSLTLLERKRLELSRALATQPRVLLLDEIAGGLTEGEVLSLVETVQEIQRNGVTILWIEHIVHALLRVVDRILAIEGGRRLIEGDPQTVMASDEVRNVYLGAEFSPASDADGSLAPLRFAPIGGAKPDRQAGSGAPESAVR
jgi:branched-chain amino acid transport system ATP-binding protein